MNKVIKNTIFICFLLFGFQINAQDAIWLSNTPPKSMEKSVETYGMHRLSVLKAKRRGGKSNSRGDKERSGYNKTVKDSAKKGDRKSTDKKGKKPYRPTPKKYIQWLRKGSSVRDAKYTCLDEKSDYDLTLMSPEGKEEDVEVVKDSICYAKFELNEEGYYNAYLIIKE
ncbi:MAG: hypothetical protein ABFR05_12865, partial [Bacteroidota bacterium]